MLLGKSYFIDESGYRNKVMRLQGKDHSMTLIHALWWPTTGFKWYRWDNIGKKGLWLGGNHVTNHPPKSCRASQWNFGVVKALCLFKEFLNALNDEGFPLYANGNIWTNQWDAFLLTSHRTGPFLSTIVLTSVKRKKLDKCPQCSPLLRGSDYFIAVIQLPDARTKLSDSGGENISLIKCPEQIVSIFM